VDPAVDNERLWRQLRRVYNAMADCRWRTLAQLEALTGDPQASISARLRDLRKPRFGANTVERERVHADRGLYAYRLVEPHQLADVREPE
jgi:hypothetical protein